MVFNEEKKESEPSITPTLKVKPQKRADVRSNTERKLVAKKKFKEESDVKFEFDIKSEPQFKYDSDNKPESGVRGIYKRGYLRISTESEESNLPDLDEILNLSSAVEKESTAAREDTPPAERTRNKSEKKKKKKRR